MKSSLHSFSIPARVLTSLFYLIVFLSASIFPFQTVPAAPSPEDQASALLAKMTPEEKVGQLFLVTYKGTDVGAGTDIADLVTNHHVGGVVLLAKNGNVVDQRQASDSPPRQVFLQIRQLQQDLWEYAQLSQVNSNTGQSFSPVYIPLFTGIQQEGDGYPNDQILHGLTPLPNEMALGATWSPDLAAQVGDILGKELSILGINLLLGPSLDVLESPQLELTNSLGTRAFGGDPYWVGLLGRAYISGVHEGSSGKVAVVAKHFPGHGSSDRLPEEEVATVRKSLDELKSFDLAPFFAVTGNSPSPEETTDALLTSHIRYQGLQGNIRSTTRPVSFDPQALSLLMSLPELSAWRQNGGVMVSEDLGSLAVRRFYDLTSQTFDARRVALNAFLAGNDLLYISDFSSADDTNSTNSAIRTLDFFAQKYHEDSAFAQRVDGSVLRILTLKSRLYKNFTLSNVLADENALDQLGTSSQVTFDVARKAATLISPTQA